jgi:integrase
MVKTVELRRVEGSIIRLKQRDPNTGERRDSKFWYILYYVGTRQVRENTKANDYSKAYNMLIERRADAAEGKPAVSDIRRYRYEDIRDSYISTLKLKKRISLYSRTDESGQPNVTFRGLDHFNKLFKNMVATEIDSDKIRKYTEWRSREGQADPTIRRQLVALRAMLRLAAREKKIFSVPYFSMPEDSDAAGQYIEPSQFATLPTHLPNKLHPFFKFLYHTGCRIGAAKEITWPMVSLDASVIEIPAALMKARKPLTVVLAGKGLEPVAKELKKMFLHNGDRVFYIANYRAEWQKACHKVGLGVRDKNRRFNGVRIHDLRCSAAVNLIDAGVSEDLVMKIGGWKTKAMFSRYNVANKDRLREAMERGGEYTEKKAMVR